VITANAAQQIPNFTSKVITHTKTTRDSHNYVQKEKERRRKEKKKKGVERSYQVRCWVHLSYYLLRIMLREVEGASATPSHLNI